MNFGQLREYNIRKIFLEKPYTICDEETSLRLFSSKSKLGISLGQKSEILYSLLMLYVRVKDHQSILKLRCRSIVFTSYKAFPKKEGRETASFSVWLLKKNTSHVMFH